MPQAVTTPNSMGSPNPDNAVGHLPQGKPGGEITISRAEAAALTAFEADKDSTQALDRAKRESGLSYDQLRRLRTRADNLRSSGYTLKSGMGNAIFKPKNYAGDEHGLLGKNEMASDAKTSAERRQQRQAQAKKAAKSKATPTVRETARMQEAWTRVHECDGDKMCGPCRIAASAEAGAVSSAGWMTAKRAATRHPKRKKIVPSY